MKNKTVGMILLCVAAICTTVDLAVNKLANAIHTGAVYLGGKGGTFPKVPIISTEVLLIVLLITVLGVIFLFRYERD